MNWRGRSSASWARHYNHYMALNARSTRCRGVLPMSARLNIFWVFSLRYRSRRDYAASLHGGKGGPAPQNLPQLEPEHIRVPSEAVQFRYACIITLTMRAL